MLKVERDGESCIEGIQRGDIGRVTCMGRVYFTGLLAIYIRLAASQVGISKGWYQVSAKGGMAKGWHHQQGLASVQAK
jgi:hypothetical protein